MNGVDVAGLREARLNLARVVRRTIDVLALTPGPSPINGRGEEERKALWKAFDRTAARWESAFQEGAMKAFENDRGEVLAIVNGAKKAALKRKASINWKKVLKEIEEYLAEAGDEFWRDVFAPLIEGVVVEQGQRWAVQLGVEFDVENLGAREWFNEYEMRFAQPINETTEREIAQIMNRAQREGSSVPQIQNQLDALFDRYISGKTPDDPEWEWFTERTPPHRTETIARTETVRASNAGTNGLFKDWGVKKKEWLSTKDDRVRTYDEGNYDHEEADGQVVGIDEKFVVSGELLDYPGDPSGSAGNVINCRCTELPVVEEGEELQPEEPESQVPQFNNAADAENYFKEELGIEAKFSKGMNADGLRDMARQVIEVHDRFGVQLDYIGTQDGNPFFKTRGMGNSIAGAVYAQEKSALLITPRATKAEYLAKAAEESNKAIMGTIDSLLRYLKKTKADNEVIEIVSNKKERNWWSTDGTVNDIANHELGHLILDTHKDNKTLKESARNARRHGWGYALGDYANKNLSEFVAESFAAYMNGNHKVLDPGVLNWFVENDKWSQ